MLQKIREANLVTGNRNDEYTKNIRNALLDDPQLMRLLGGTRVFEDIESHPAAPHIAIGQSDVLDWTGCRNIAGERTVSLQVWPRTCDKLRAQEFIDCAHRALEVAGLINGNTPIQLRPEYSGSRSVPESREYHGILRYRAVRRDNAA